MKKYRVLRDFVLAGQPVKTGDTVTPDEQTAKNLLAAKNPAIEPLKPVIRKTRTAKEKKEHESDS